MADPIAEAALFGLGRLLQTAGELLTVSRGAVYLRHGEPQLYHLTDALGPAPALTELSSGCPLIEALLALDPHACRSAESKHNRETPSKASFETLRGEFVGLLEQAVRRELDNGRPACFLSGGK